ncbi:MAG: hypothetical protein P9M15_05105 [Candidatus Electryoneaceae bacterium]|nr:hypothetical protein [Candidatus Electryoneaceae bacterium]
MTAVVFALSDRLESGNPVHIIENLWILASARMTILCIFGHTGERKSSLRLSLPE